MPGSDQERGSTSSRADTPPHKRPRRAAEGQHVENERSSSSSSSTPCVGSSSPSAKEKERYAGDILYCFILHIAFVALFSMLSTCCATHPGVRTLCSKECCIETLRCRAGGDGCTWTRSAGIIEIVLLRYSDERAVLCRCHNTLEIVEIVMYVKTSAIPPPPPPNPFPSSAFTEGPLHTVCTTETQKTWLNIYSARPRSTIPSSTLCVRRSLFA